MTKSRVWPALPLFQEQPPAVSGDRNPATRRPSNQENTLARRDGTASCRLWQAIVPGTQNKPQDTLQIRKTPWHGVTKQPPAVPLPGPNVTPEPNEKIKGLASTSTVPGTA